MNELDKLSGLVLIKVAKYIAKEKEYRRFFLERTDVGGIISKEPAQKKQTKNKDKWVIDVSGFDLLKKEIQERIIKELRRLMK